VGATPTVYFIDDSATMREVIKIAFRRENINVVAYNDAASALAQFDSAKPDVVITDVIMPDKDGYEVCQFIKQHASLSHTPVILMSGVVNRSVAEKAFSVKADELIRKPFQPQDLITRVRHLLQPAAPVATPPAVAAATAAATLSSIFQAPAAAAGAPRVARLPQAPAVPVAYPPSGNQVPTPAPRPAVAAPVVAPAVASAPVKPAPAATSMSASADIPKLRLEVMRLEGLVKKLQSELAAEREYARALEEHVKTLQESE
jgi:CheY-like chemotaxis protein